MKNIQKALGALAIFISVTPMAIAEPRGSDAVREFAIAVKGEAVPASLGSLDYPFLAVSKGRSGECAIRLEVARTGEAKDFDIMSCSHVTFQREAEQFAETLSFSPSSEEQTHELIVSWSTD